jgi:hypothetical protein
VSAVIVRLQPYPYRAALAICSDLDETPDRHVYWDIARWLNTTDDDGPMGPGAGLEVGNSLYFDMPPDQFAYWNTDDAGRAMARALVASGHVDCFHSFGDLALRAHAGRALDELARHDLRIRVWIDHAVAPTNFGSDIMRGSGDLPGAPAYHADLTCGYGVRFVWRGRVTSVTGQDVRRRLSTIVTPGHVADSSRALLKEAAKGALARLGSAKYAMHPANATLRPATLRDGRPVLEFLRANPSWRGVDQSATAAGLAEALTGRFLDNLEASGGTCVLYTHLGKITDRARPLPDATRDALRGLAERARGGRVLVTTTSRLLEYREARDTVGARVGADGATIQLTPQPHHVLDGLTFYVSDPARARVVASGRELALVRNPPDHTGRPSVSLPWPRLEFPRAVLSAAPGGVA